MQKVLIMDYKDLLNKIRDDVICLIKQDISLSEKLCEEIKSEQSGALLELWTKKMADRIESLEKLVLYLYDLLAVKL